VSKPREFWINAYAPYHNTWDCVAHSTLKRAITDVGAACIDKCIHVVEYSALKQANAEIDSLKQALREEMEHFAEACAARDQWRSEHMKNVELTSLVDELAESLRDCLGAIAEEAPATTMPHSESVLAKYEAHKKGAAGE
jgi:hypothetical protein